jgi:DNA-directed RNA polymerase sigma subunit (sigma70/sigma32)
MIHRLPPVEQFVLEQRFWNERTLAEIGRAFGVSRERIRQIEVAALTRVKRFALTDGLLNGK